MARRRRGRAGHCAGVFYGGFKAAAAVRHQQSAGARSRPGARRFANQQSIVDGTRARVAAKPRRARAASRPNERSRRAARRARRAAHADGGTQGRRIRFHDVSRRSAARKSRWPTTESSKISGVVGRARRARPPARRSPPPARRARGAAAVRASFAMRSIPRAGPSRPATSRLNSAAARTRSRAAARSTRASISRAAPAPKSSRSRRAS